MIAGYDGVVTPAVERVFAEIAKIEAAGGSVEIKSLAPNKHNVTVSCGQTATGAWGFVGDDTDLLNLLRWLWRSISGP